MNVTIETVTDEFLALLQRKFGAVADVYGAGGVTAAEVTTPTGAPVQEVQDRPKIAVFGPSLRNSELWGGFVPDTVITSIDTGSMNATSAPMPILKHLDFQLVVTSTRESTDSDGSPGILYFEQQLSVVFAGDYLLGAGWDIDEENPIGYYFELTSDPKRMPAKKVGLHACSATVTIRNVRLTDLSQSNIPLVGTVNFTTSLL